MHIGTTLGEVSREEVVLIKMLLVGAIYGLMSE